MGEKTNPLVVYGVPGFLSLVVLVLVVKVRFLSAQTLPPKPPMPRIEAATKQQVRNTQVASSPEYQKKLKDDASMFGIFDADIESSLKKKFPYGHSEDEVSLRPGNTHEAAGLRMQVKKGRNGGKRHRSLELEITNLTGSHLAYRIDTLPSRGNKPCYKKEPLAHNALVLKPNQTITRVECIYKSGWSLNITNVETMAIPTLGAAYISQLPPEEIGVPRRLASDHLSKWKKSCSLGLFGQNQALVDSGEIVWRNIIDFYARHDCQKFSYVPSYTAFQKDNEQPLPILP